MFYSQFILAKKGPLGTIWIAAHLERKLRKNQVANTDIGVSVDSILFPDVPIALRLSSHLLLGVVRIYSKKVNYLFDDCSEALLKIKQAFRSTAVDLPPEESTAPYHSITLPETFDLDDFELPDNEIFQGNYVDHHVSTTEQITLQDNMDGAAYNTSQFGLDERFGDGDASQIGLDLGEDLFIDRVAGTGQDGVALSTDFQASVRPATPLKTDEINEGTTEASDAMLDDVNRNQMQGVDFADAPATPRLVGEPVLTTVKEALGCDYNLVSVDRNQTGLATEENSETVRSTSDQRHLESRNAVSSAYNEMIPEGVPHAPTEGNRHVLCQQEFKHVTPCGDPPHAMEKDAVRRSSEINILSTDSTCVEGEGSGAKSRETVVSAVDGCETSIVLAEGEGSQGAKLGKTAVSFFDKRETFFNVCPDGENACRESYARGILQPALEELLERQAGACEQSKDFEIVDPAPSGGLPSFPIHKLQPCSLRAKEPDMLCHDAGVSVKVTDLPYKADGHCPLEAAHESLNNASTMPEMQDKRCEEAGVMIRTSDANLSLGIIPCERIQSSSSMLDGQLHNYLSGNTQFQNSENPGNPAVFLPEKFHSVPEVPANLVNNFLGGSATDNSHVVDEKEGTGISGRKHSLAERIQSGSGRLDEQLHNYLSGNTQFQNSDKTVNAAFSLPEKFHSVSEVTANLANNFLEGSATDNSHVGDEQEGTGFSGKKHSPAEHIQPTNRKLDEQLHNHVSGNTHFQNSDKSTNPAFSLPEKFHSVPEVTANSANDFIGGSTTNKSHVEDEKEGTGISGKKHSLAECIQPGSSKLDEQLHNHLSGSTQFQNSDKFANPSFCLPEKFHSVPEVAANLANDFLGGSTTDKSHAGYEKEGTSISGKNHSLAEHIQPGNGKLDAQLHNYLSENIQLENSDKSANPAFSLPEKFLSAPEATENLANNFFGGSTTDKSHVEDEQYCTSISGRKRRSEESFLTPEIHNSEESFNLHLSKRTAGPIPYNDDLLSSILGGRPSVMEIKPTPPEVALMKRVRTIPRVGASKRKVLMDDSMILHGDIIRQQLTSTEDIRRVRRKAPCTRSEVWMIQKQFMDDDIFSKPISTGLSMELNFLHSKIRGLSRIKIFERNERNERNASANATMDVSPNTKEAGVGGSTEVSVVHNDKRAAYVDTTFQDVNQQAEGHFVDSLQAKASIDAHQSGASQNMALHDTLSHNEVHDLSGIKISERTEFNASAYATTDVPPNTKESDVGGSTEVSVSNDKMAAHADTPLQDANQQAEGHLGDSFQVKGSMDAPQSGASENLALNDIFLENEIRALSRITISEKTECNASVNATMDVCPNTKAVGGSTEVSVVSNDKMAAYVDTRLHDANHQAEGHFVDSLQVEASIDAPQYGTSQIEALPEIETNSAGLAARERGNREGTPVLDFPSTAPIEGEFSNLTADPEFQSTVSEKTNGVDALLQVGASCVTPDTKLDDQPINKMSSNVVTDVNEIGAVGNEFPTRGELLLDKTEGGRSVEDGVYNHLHSFASASNADSALATLPQGTGELNDRSTTTNVLLRENEKGLNFDHNNVKFSNAGVEEPRLDASHAVDMEVVKNSSIDNGDAKLIVGDGLQNSMDVERTGLDNPTVDNHDAIEDIRAGHDTEFLNADANYVLEVVYDERMPSAATDAQFLENSGWSSRTRDVARYLQGLFGRETENDKKVLAMDNLLVGKTRKEASRMFFESLVLTTRDYIHVDQSKPFENINIEPRAKLMKSSF